MGGGARPVVAERGAVSTIPAGVIVRAATEDDLPAVHAIECASFGDPWALEGFRDLLDHPRAKVEVAVDAGGELLGYAIAWYVADESEIANIAVAPSARRRGVGALLLDRILRAAAEFGAQSVFLEVRESNEEARKLYEARQFEVAGKRTKYYRKPDEDALIMRRKL
jgi:ribosomal-protein-alanine N-acetyltransferase